jgi:adenine phosphoribosyltransferase
MPSEREPRKHAAESSTDESGTTPRIIVSGAAADTPPAGGIAIPGGLSERVGRRLRDIADFPKPGILFKDITPVLADALLLEEIVAHLALEAAALSTDVVVGIESRGFLFASPVALRLQCGVVPVRKPGKLPYRTRRVEYALEYGSDVLEAHEDAFTAGQRVLIVDDVLATGGTLAATAELVRALGGEVVGAAVVVELGFLAGRQRLGSMPLLSVLRVE